jgi:hypothetical protein
MPGRAGTASTTGGKTATSTSASRRSSTGGFSGARVAGWNFEILRSNRTAYCLLRRGLIPLAVAIFFRILHHDSNGILDRYQWRSAVFNPESASALGGQLLRGKFFASPGSSLNQQRHACHKYKPDSSGPGKLAPYENHRSIDQRHQELPPAGTSVLRGNYSAP